MLGEGLLLNVSQTGDDWLCGASKSHRSQSQRLSGPQNHHNGDHSNGVKSDFALGAAAPCDVRATGDDEQPKEKLAIVAELAGELSSVSNIQRFLHCVTPSVKTTTRNNKMHDEGFKPYYVLGDLWEAFKEWSAYGAGVPLILNEMDNVVQYYVPYLSGIQLYAESSKSSHKSRQPGEDINGDFSRESTSDGSSDSEQDRGCLNCSTRGKCFRKSRLSLSDENTALREGFSSDEGESVCSHCYLVFEYFERSPPHGREPFADKISSLAVHFPELKTLRSCDLHPSSWISVAWYPIYRIPLGPTLKPLDACFLSYHCLHAPVSSGATCEVDSTVKTRLPVFGLASYKFKASQWVTDGGCEYEMVSSLLQAAGNWLTALQANHPDFSFFCRNWG
ncbi:unnamed protein product [Cuscuta campestris]|uniref:DUF789 domain-containing protein n=1 Tax=Cuscuta campestris TaxID=132261 RepID=A0A484KHP0_9ASTE|nr:unnamed protein product [Cuscuta campestris]